MVWSCDKVTLPVDVLPMVTSEFELGVVPLPGGFQSPAVSQLPVPLFQVYAVAAGVEISSI